MSKTTNYQLTVWDYGDEDFSPQKVREDWKLNFTKVDAAMKAEELARPKIVTGVFAGEAAYNDTNAIQAIRLGFRPKVVVIEGQEGGGEYGGLILDGHPVFVGTEDSWIGRVSDKGFEVKNVNHHYFNYNAKTYYYLAIG